MSQSHEGFRGSIAELLGSSTLFGQKFVFTMTAIAITIRRTETTSPPLSTRVAAIAAATNAEKAVTNQPEITVITPDTRYTAVSRSQARSANDDPIATMKVT